MTSLTADTARAMVRAAHARIQERREEINALNVFPIPDADTGTNLALTLEASARAASALSGNESAGQALMAISRATILGARGNSGVIFSQYLRGLARALSGAPQPPDGASLATALAAAAEAAYGAVDNPVEGTILTVARRAAEGARAAAADGNVAAVLRAAAREAGEAVADTTRLLPQLAQAGVVDSAGLGLFHVLDAMAEVAEGRVAPVSSEQRASAAVRAAEEQAAEGVVYGFEVQFVLEGEGLDPQALRAALRPLGDSLVVVGDDALLKVHIHAPDAEAVLRAARAFGRPEGVSIANLDAEILALHEKDGSGPGA
ncbi:MAG: DAK2 domain-containing protein [Firmicutes bacterium]|nr:DAK2 domain-containing protein [Bacillota bacterium]